MVIIIFLYQNKCNNIFVLIHKGSPFNVKGFPLVQAFLRISLLKYYVHLLDLLELHICMIALLCQKNLKKYLRRG